MGAASDPDRPLDASADEPDEEVGLSLEELSQSYSQAMAGRERNLAAVPSGTASADPPVAGNRDDHSSPAADMVALHRPADRLSTLESESSEAEFAAERDSCPVTPLSIVEAILFVGKPTSGPITAAEIAGLMRGVREDEVDAWIVELNQAYVDSGRATRIAACGGGYRLQLAADLEFLRGRFQSRTREVRLNQAAIDCLALIAYQPGISREKLEHQRGQPSGSVLNQLVRRQLIEIRREQDGKRQLALYYPTERMLALAGLASLDDLPHSEDLD